MRALTEDDSELLKLARMTADAAYCPYSRFPVGAAVATDKGVFVGCNIENASYGLAVCAERVAVFSAIAAGARHLLRLAICCRAAQETDAVASRMPCGACRQVIAEFMTGDAEILVDGAGVWRVEDLLPQAFRLEVRKPTLPD
jgi:cytidine deaminase